MNFKTPKSVQEIASRFNLQIKGDTQQIAQGINEIHKVRKGDVTFVDVEKYYSKSLNSDATIILINKDIECPEGKTLLITEDPFVIYNQLVWEERPMTYLESNRGENLVIGAGTVIEYGVVIGHNVTIGRNCHIQPGVFIGDGTIVGDDVEIQAGALIGTDAFYYKKINGQYHKWRSGGRVIIEDRVEVGAGCTLSRGVSGETVIGEGTKLDCQVHIAHGAVIGKNCLIAAQCGVAGKTIIGDNCTIYGQVGIAQAITIGHNTVILAKSGVSKSLEGGKTYFGAPAQEARALYKEQAALKMLLRK